MDEPLRKKMKIPNEFELKQETIEAMMNSKKNLIPVLDDGVFKDIPTLEVYVGIVKDKKNISKVILSLNSVLPLPDLQHLKRVKGGHVILAKVVNLSVEELKKKLANLEQFLDEKITVLSVPGKCPIVRKQYDKAHQVWPCNFHGNKYMESLVGGSFFSCFDVKTHRMYMAVAYEVARIHYELLAAKKMLDNALLLDFATFKGVVVVDPKIDSIVAIGYDNRCLNPCMHSVMIAVDCVARSQRGGAWNLDEKFEFENSNFCGVPKVFVDGLNDKFDGLKFGARPTVRKGEKEDSLNVFEAIRGRKCENLGGKIGKSCTELNSKYTAGKEFNENDFNAICESKMNNTQSNANVLVSTMKNELNSASLVCKIDDFYANCVKNDNLATNLNDSDVVSQENSDINDVLLQKCDVSTSFASNSSENSKKCVSLKLDTAKIVDSSIKVGSVDEQLSDKPSGPYLCTDYLVYSTVEPCLMCCMALVHSRASRVFFGTADPKNGALLSKTKLHTFGALNHHYEVFTGFFEDAESADE